MYIELFNSYFEFQEYTGLLMIPTGPTALAAPVTPVGPPPTSSFVPGLGRGLSGPSPPLSPFARSLSRLTHSPASPLLPQHLSRLSQSPATPRLAASPRLSHPLRPGSTSLHSPGLSGSAAFDSELWDDSTVVSEPLLPQACFHMLWTEAQASAGAHRRVQATQPPAPHRRAVLPLERRVSAFISEDHVASRHLCYLVENAQRLCCVKLEPVTSAKGRREEMAFGGVQFLPALQAVYMPGQRLIALLDPRHTVFLYSGTFRVSWRGWGLGREGLPFNCKLNDHSLCDWIWKFEPDLWAFILLRANSMLLLGKLKTALVPF